jgi:hypothetical protein
VLVGFATCGYVFVRGRDDDRSAEVVLRRGIALANRTRASADTLVSVYPDSIPHDSAILARPYQVSFVDTYPYDASSYWSFFTRPAFVWLVCFEGGPIYEGEVRHLRDGRWTVWLTRTNLKQCQGRGGGA